MKTEIETPSVPIPGIPVPETPFDDIFTLRYIFKQHIEEKSFRATGTMSEIVARSKVHCEQCGYRFLYVKPFLSDFLKDEIKHRSTY